MGKELKEQYVRGKKVAYDPKKEYRIVVSRGSGRFALDVLDMTLLLDEMTSGKLNEADSRRIIADMLKHAPVFERYGIDKMAEVIARCDGETTPKRVREELEAVANTFQVLKQMA